MFGGDRCGERTPNANGQPVGEAVARGLRITRSRKSSDQNTSSKPRAGLPHQTSIPIDGCIARYLEASCHRPAYSRCAAAAMSRIRHPVMARR